MEECIHLVEFRLLFFFALFFQSTDRILSIEYDGRILVFSQRQIDDWLHFRCTFTLFSRLLFNLGRALRAYATSVDIVGYEEES